jgi:hypothetical protein
MSKTVRKGTASGSAAAATFDAMPKVPLAAVFSFLKDMRGALTWTAQDLIETLNIAKPDADKILTLLRMQDYVERTANADWLTTAAGESVCDSKQPRFKRESVDAALSTLSDRIAAINQDRQAEFRITKAVAFGEFLTGRANCQSADVGIQLAARQVTGGDNGARFLKQLGARNPFLHIRPYEDWMGKRTHRRLL